MSHSSQREGQLRITSRSACICAIWTCCWTCRFMASLSAIAPPEAAAAPPYDGLDELEAGAEPEYLSSKSLYAPDDDGADDESSEDAEEPNQDIWCGASLSREGGS